MDLIGQLTTRFRDEFIGRMISVVSAAIFILALARLLDPDEYGLLFLALSIFGVVTLFSKLGIAGSAARYITHYKGTDSGQIPHILRFSFLSNLGTILVACCMFFFAHRYIAVLLGEPGLLPFLWLGVFFIPSETLMVYVRTTLQGFEEIRISAALQAMNQGTTLIFALSFVFLGYGAIGALVGSIMAFAVTAIIGLTYIYLQYYRTIERSPIEQSLQRRISEYSLPLAATSAADVLDKRVDAILVGFFLGPVAVAYYMVSRQIIDFIETPISALGFTLAPAYEDQKVKGNFDTAAHLYEQALSHGLLLYIPAASGLILVSEPLIEIIFGSDYIEAVPVLRIFAIYAVLRVITALTSNGLDFMGRARERAIVKGLTAIMNVVLNLVLIPLLGVVGAAIATIITYSLYAFANMYIFTREFDLRARWILQQMRTILLITLIMVVSIYPFISYISGLMMLFAVVGLGIVIWLVLVSLSGMIDIRDLSEHL